MYKAANIEISVFLYIEMKKNTLKDVLNNIRTYLEIWDLSHTLRFGRITVTRPTFLTIKLDSETIRNQKRFNPVKNSQDFAVH